MAKLTQISGLATLVLLGLLAMPTYAQNNGGGADPNAGQGQGQGGGRQRGGQNGGQGGGGGGRGNYDPAAMRQHRLDQLKDQLGMTDDEFKAVQPKIEKIMDLQRDAMAAQFGRAFGGGRQRGGGGGGGNGGGNAPAAGGAGGGGGGAAAPAPAAGGAQPAQSEVAIKTKVLTDLLEDKDAKPEEIKAKLDDLRAEKAKSKDELTKAQADLRELLSQRQEAVLVTNGMLD